MFTLKQRLSHMQTRQGNGVVLLTQKDFVAKMDVILTDESKLKKIDSDINISNLTHHLKWM